MTFVDRLQILVQRPLRLTTVGCPGMVVRGARQIPSLALTRDRQTRLGIYHRLPLGSVHGTSFPCRKFRSMVHSPVLRCRESRSGDVPKSAVLLLRSNTAEPSSSNRFFPALDLRCLKCKPRRQLRQRLLPLIHSFQRHLEFERRRMPPGNPVCLSYSAPVHSYDTGRIHLKPPSSKIVLFCGTPSLFSFRSRDDYWTLSN